MRLGKDLTGKPIISVTDGRLLGSVKDVYINEELYWLTGIHVGHEGLLKRKSRIIPRDAVILFGIDAILVKNADVITDEQQLMEADHWLRLSKLRGREVDTPGGTRVGTIGDIILGEEGHITGFSLARVFIEGPVAERGIIPREALIDTGSEDERMTVDLPKIEKLHQTPPEENEA
ncbi:MAG: PRC-barrel domain-containing protein [Anaerolineae bacterium]